MRKLYSFLFIIIILIAGSVRLYRLYAPVADWHSWRQVDTAAVARNFLKFGFDPFHPRYDDLSNIQSGKDNLMGWRMVEFPLYQSIAALGSFLLPQLRIEVWLRIVSIVSSVGSAILLMLLVGKYIDRVTGLFAGFLYAVLPYGVYYGRTILPEPFMVALSLLSLWFLVQWTENAGRTRVVYLLGASVVGACALLVKPVAIFLLFVALYIQWKNRALSWQWILEVLCFWAVVVGPVVWWRKWILQFPEGIPVYEWLFNAGNIRLKGAWFYWLFAERLAKLMLGYWGILPFGIGLLVAPSKKEGWLFRWLLFGGVLYWIIIAAGNVQHDYYQIVVLPTIVIFGAKGYRFLLQNTVFSRFWSLGVAGASFLLMLAFSWYTVRTYYWINRPEIVEVGKLADTLLPKDAKVIAPYNGDTTFLYQTNRQGWPLGFDIDKKLKAGATHYVTVSPTDEDWETRDLARAYQVLVRTEKYAIIDLTQPKEK